MGKDWNGMGIPRTLALANTYSLLRSMGIPWTLALANTYSLIRKQRCECVTKPLACRRLDASLLIEDSSLGSGSLCLLLQNIKH